MTDETDGAKRGTDDARDTDGTPAPGTPHSKDRSEKDAGKSNSPAMKTGSDLPVDKAGTIAYEAGRRLLSPLNIEASRDAYFHIDKRVMSGLQEVSAAPGPVPRDQIEELRARYEPVPNDDDARGALREKRLIVLVGTAGSGRSTTGLFLLDELTDGEVARLDPAARPFLPGADQIQPGHGYLASVDSATPPGRVAADRLAADLAAKDAYCVVTAHPSPMLRHELGFYCVEHTQADPVAILGQHVHAGVRPDDDDDLAARMAELAASREVADLLGPAARPTEAAQAAALLLAHGRGERSREEVDGLIAQLVLDDRIEEWFSVLVGVTHGPRADRARRLTAARIAVAVFDGLPRHLAERTAEPLATRMAMPPDQPGDAKTAADASQILLPRIGSRGVDPEETATLLATTPIAVTRGDVPFFSRTVPGETIAYRDGRLPSAVLRCVWHNHYPLRAPVIAWLGDLSRDDSWQVRLRAAQAAGLLCALDYTYTLDALVVPAASASPKPERGATPETGLQRDTDDDEDAPIPVVFRKQRQFAAIAMDHVTRDERLRGLARYMLRRWRRNANPALRWTAACAYGYDVGAQNPVAALEELKVLGTPWELNRPYEGMKPEERRQELAVFHTAGESVAGLFGRGAHREVLAVLHEWSVDPRWSVRLLAAQAIIFLTTKMASTIGTPETGGARVDPDHRAVQGPAAPLLSPADRDERARWPILVALHGRHPELQRQGAELIRFALASREQKVVLEAFEDIFFIAEDFPETALPAVEAFLPLVIKDESDRGKLLGLLRKMRDAWADPLSVDVAIRLEEVIVGIPVVTGRKVFS